MLKTPTGFGLTHSYTDNQEANLVKRQFNIDPEFYKSYITSTSTNESGDERENDEFAEKNNGKVSIETNKGNEKVVRTSSSISDLSIHEEEKGKEVIDMEDYTVAMLMPDQAFGEISILHKIDRGQKELDRSYVKPIGDISEYSAIACTTCEVFCFDKEVFFKLDVDQDDKVIMKLRETWLANDPSIKSMVESYQSKYKTKKQQMRAIENIK
jgi:CRP-like cAMP-binding protein